MFLDIEASADWESITPISKGWSSDKKYYIRAKSGEELLLRVSDIEQSDAKKKEYEIITKYSKLGFNMSMPKEFGICNEGKNVYILLSWMSGKDLEEVLPKLSEKEQYLLGRQAGSILRKIHSIPIDKEDIPQNTKKEKKLLQLSRYEESQVRISDDQVAVKYVKDNIDKIWKEPPVYLHGDFHPGNLIYMNDGTIGVIDFNRWEVGDPYEEFYKLESFGTEVSIPYCIGQIDAYFQDDIPMDFWIVNAVYVAHASLYSIKWAEKFGQKDIDGMVRRARRAFYNYSNFEECIPRWYTDNYSKEFRKIDEYINYYKKNGYIKEMRKYVGHAPIMSCACGVIIENSDGEILLQKRRDNGRWAIIGGAMEMGETFEEAVRREAKEESGLSLGKLEVFKLLSGRNLIIEYPNGDVTFGPGIVFITKEFKGEIVNDPEEVIEHKFFKHTKLPDELNAFDADIIYEWAEGKI